MMVSVTRRTGRWVAALSGRLSLDANPLRRRTDRAESWIRLLLVVLFLVVSPLAALGLGRLTADVAAHAARVQAATEHRVTAVLLTGGSRAAGDSLYGPDQPIQVRARWTAPDGRARSGEVLAPAGSRAGQRWPVWVDQAGRPVYPPIGPGEIASRVVAVVALTPALLGLLLLLILTVTRQVLDRRRMADWAAEWSTVEPQWTKRAP
jgi:hypothetical protein